MKILVTGTAGFIGMYTAARFAQRGDEVVGIDSINDYYDVELKYGRLAETGIDKNEIKYGKPVQSGKYQNYRFIKLNIQDKENLEKLFAEEKFDRVCHLAAQAGVRYSIDNPQSYADSNLDGFLKILECCRHHKIEHLTYASSSSVYGMNDKVPFSEDDRTDEPVSLYAATKKANEVMAYSYSKLYGLPTTGLRFFTVYGPWGRPDMAPMLFAEAISAGRPIKVFNNGDMYRDFTYVDDIVTGVVKVVDKAPQQETPYKIYNIGCSNPVRLMDFIRTIEESLGTKADMQMMPMQPGDVYRTYADTSHLENDLGYKPSISVGEGVGRFIRWFVAQKSPK